MHPILVEIFGISIPSFGVMMALAFLCGITWMVVRAKAAGEKGDLYLEAGPWMILTGIVGARLLYAFYFPKEFMADPMGTLFGSGGLVWYGGVIAVVLTVILYTRLNKLKLWRFTDILTAPAALGMAIGRVGCLLAGCCYGGPCDLKTVPWAIQYPAGHETYPHHVHPSPIYESLMMLVAILILERVYRNRRYDGQTSWVFLIVYGISRFVLEYFRGDRLIWMPALDLSASQVISLVAIIAGAMLLWVNRHRYDTGIGKEVISGPTGFHPVI